jgi:hypothetical protein
VTYSDHTLTFGTANEVPFNGDWLGQGHDGVGVINGSSGLTYERNSLTTGRADQTLYDGTTGDIPVAGHWGVVPTAAAPAPTTPAAPTQTRPAPAATREPACRGHRIG